MSVVRIQSLEDKRVEVYSSLTEHQLKRTGEESGLFIAESPKVIKVALEAGYEPLSMLCEEKHIKGDAAGIIADCPDLTVYTGEREILAKLTGYKLTRGVLCAMKRKPLQDPSELSRSARRIAVLEAVCDTTNIGSIFRSATALGVDGILLTPDSCDPLNRRAIRVSMGTVFKVPWTFCENPIEFLKDSGFVTVALALHKDAVPIDSPVFKDFEKLSLVLGTEGDGLSSSTISKCDYKAIIPMHHDVDSLNVGAAAAVAFWQFRHT